MRYWLIGLAAIAILAAGMFGLPWAASERVEVVELRTQDGTGQTVTTRLWIVDDEGMQYLRVGADGSGWYQRLRDNGEFELTRQGRTARYTAKLRRDKSDRINHLMREKYTWGDKVVGVMVGSRDGSIPIELHPLN